MTSRGPRGRSRPRRLALGAATAVLLVATACQSEAPAEPAPDPSADPSAETSPVPVPTSSTPTAEPADGKVVKVPGASMRALATYTRNSDFGIVQGYNDGQSSMAFAPSLTMAPSIDAFAREWIREHGGPKVQVRQDDTVAGGKYRAWHVMDSTTDPARIEHNFGIMFLDSAWLITVRIYLPGQPETLTEEEQQAVIDSLLATFKTDLD